MIAASVGTNDFKPRSIIVLKTFVKRKNYKLGGASYGVPGVRGSIYVSGGVFGETPETIVIEAINGTFAEPRNRQAETEAKRAERLAKRAAKKQATLDSRAAKIQARADAKAAKEQAKADKLAAKAAKTNDATTPAAE
jgi:hypothetical protein